MWGGLKVWSGGGGVHQRLSFRPRAERARGNQELGVMTDVRVAPGAFGVRSSIWSPGPNRAKAPSLTQVCGAVRLRPE